MVVMVRHKVLLANIVRENEVCRLVVSGYVDRTPVAERQRAILERAEKRAPDASCISAERRAGSRYHSLDDATSPLQQMCCCRAHMKLDSVFSTQDGLVCTSYGLVKKPLQIGARIGRTTMRGKTRLPRRTYIVPDEP